MSLNNLRDFIEQPRIARSEDALTAISLFSGAGLSDLGYALAGFRFVIHVEQQEERAAVGRANFPNSCWITRDVRQAHQEIVANYRKIAKCPLDLLVATPPCQGMSSSNPSRGRRLSTEAARLERTNSLILELIPLATALRPKVIVAENVRPLLTLEVNYQGRRAKLVEHLEEGLHDYQLFTGVVNTADYGIPQERRRAIIVGVRRDLPGLSVLESAGAAPWPAPTHSDESGNELWVSVSEWLKFMAYEPLDARSKDSATGAHGLHFVPDYESNPDRYLQVSQIPALSGRSAYENNKCPKCNYEPVREGVIKCPRGHVMKNRPYVREGKKVRLVKGFHSSYRRMAPQAPAPTIMTNSSHVGSDFKIHPWEHRVLSILECADLQTVPRLFDWSPAAEAKPRAKKYLVRNLIGEALPPYFTFLHGKMLSALITGEALAPSGLATYER